MSWTTSPRLEPREAIDSLRSASARLTVLSLPTSRNASHLRASPDAPARVAAAVFREEGNPFAENGVDLSAPGTLAYLGELALETDDEFERIRQVAAAAFGEGRKALFLGGDHSVTYPLVAGVHDALGPVHLVHVDAHADLYDLFEDNPLSHASPFARIMERGLARSLTQYGIRTLSPHQRAQVQRFGVRCHEMRDRARWPPPSIEGPVYVSIDLDGLDPAFAPGVAHREPGGLSVREVLDLVAAIPGPVIGGDVVEYCPARDVEGLTALAAAKIVRELAARMLG